MRKNPFAPITLPDSCFEEIEPTTRASDGKVLQRFRLRGTDLIATEDPMDRMFHCELLEVKPMAMPSRWTFLDFEYPLKDADDWQT